MIPLWVRPALRAVILTLLVLLGLELIFHLVAAPNLRVSKLVFTGDRPQGASAALLGLRDREYYFSVDEASVEARLSALPWVKTASVEKKFPDTVAVNLVTRKPLVVSLVGGAVLSVDDTGLVFGVGTDAQGLDLPVISGVAFETLQPGSRFPEALKPLFERLAALRQTSPGLFRSISEIELRKNGAGFDAVVYPVDTPVRILLGDRWDASTIGQMFVLLDVVRKQGWTSKTKEIDFRTTPVVLRPRES